MSGPGGVALARRSVLYVVGDGLHRGLAFVLIPLYTRFFTPEDYGILGVTTTVAAVFSILALDGLDGAAIRFHFDTPDERQRRRVFSTAWIFLVGWGLALALILEVFGDPLCRTLFRAVPYGPYVRLAVWTVVLTNGFALVLRTWFLARERPVAYSLANLALFGLTAGLVILFVVGLDRGVLGSLTGTLLAVGLFSVTAGGYLVWSMGLGFSADVLRGLLAYAVPLVPHLLGLWALGLADRIVLERHATLSDVGTYALATQVGQILNVFAIGLGNAIVPYFYRVADRSDGPIVLGRIGLYYVVVLTWGALGLASLGPPALRLIAGDAYAAAQTLAPWMVLAYYARGVYFLFSTALSYRKRTRILSAVTTAVAALAIGLNVHFVPQFGATAAVLTAVIAFVAHAGVVAILAQRAYRVRYPVRRLARVTALGLILYGAARLVDGISPLATLTTRGILVLSYPAILWLSGSFDARERAAVRRLLLRETA